MTRVQVIGKATHCNENAIAHTVIVTAYILEYNGLSIKPLNTDLITIKFIPKKSRFGIITATHANILIKAKRMPFNAQSFVGARFNTETYHIEVINSCEKKRLEEVLIHEICHMYIYPILYQKIKDADFWHANERAANQLTKVLLPLVHGVTKVTNQHHNRVQSAIDKIIKTAKINGKLKS